MFKVSLKSDNNEGQFTWKII